MTSTTERPATPIPPKEPSWWDRQGDLIMRRPFNEWTFTHMNWLMPDRAGGPWPPAATGHCRAILSRST